MALTISVKKPDSLPTDALSEQALGSRDLAVPLKGCVPGEFPQCEYTSTAGLGTVSPHRFLIHPGSKGHTVVSSLGTSIALGPFNFRDRVASLLWYPLPLLFRAL